MVSKCAELSSFFAQANKTDMSRNSGSKDQSYWTGSSYKPKKKEIYWNFQTAHKKPNMLQFPGHCANNKHAKIGRVPKKADMPADKDRRKHKILEFQGGS